jgi:DNA-binding transcriptional ArsR family regulator
LFGDGENMGIEIIFPAYIANNNETLLQRIQFSFSPLHEMFRSMHVLNNPKHHGIHLLWVIEAKKKLTENLQNDLHYFNLCFELGVPPILLPGVYQSVFSIKEELDLLSKRLTVENARKIHHELALVSVHRENQFIPSLAKGIEWEGFTFSNKSDILEDLKRKPKIVFNRLLNFIEEYCNRIFSPVWDDLQGKLLDEIVEKTTLLKVKGFSAFIDSLSSERIRWSNKKNTLYFHKPFKKNYQMKSDESIIFMPSYFVWPHFFVDEMKEGILIAYDSSKAKEEALPEQPIEKMVNIYRALGEPSRLYLLKILQDRALTTQSLAQICHLSEGAVSRHLQVLKKANLVTSEKDGKYVLYKSRKDVFQTLSRLVMEATNHFQSEAHV